MRWLIIVAFLLASAPVTAADLVPLPPQPAGVQWPTASWPEAVPGDDVDRPALDAAVERAFAATGRSGLPDTRALVAVHHGAIVVERYAAGFGPDKRFQSWSMAKSITQALVGILVRQGTLSLSASVNLPAWRSAGDPRAQLTLDHLLHMSSGLANADDDAKDAANSLVVAMMFGNRTAKMAEYAAAVSLAHPPGTHWAYSTGTSMIIAGLAQRSVGGSKDAMVAFMRGELFDRLGMRSAVPEFDAGGTFMGGGFFWASARDYARFGYLYLRDGVWDGARVLPPGWVDYTRTRAPAANNGTYGAHFWLNLEPGADQFRLLPGGPDSTFAATGNDGQVIAIVPPYDLVLVRLGEMHTSSWETVPAELAAIVAAFAPKQAQGPRGE